MTFQRMMVRRRMVWHAKNSYKGCVENTSFRTYAGYFDTKLRGRHSWPPARSPPAFAAASSISFVRVSLLALRSPAAPHQIRRHLAGACHYFFGVTACATTRSTCGRSSLRVAPACRHDSTATKPVGRSDTEPIRIYLMGKKEIYTNFANSHHLASRQVLGIPNTYH